MSFWNQIRWSKVLHVSSCFYTLSPDSPDRSNPGHSLILGWSNLLNRIFTVSAPACSINWAPKSPGSPCFDLREATEVPCSATAQRPQLESQDKSTETHQKLLAAVQTSSNIHVSSEPLVIYSYGPNLGIPAIGCFNMFYSHYLWVLLVE